MKRVVIRTLGGNGIGYGHYYRCLSLAKAIRQLNNGVEVVFIINDELESLIINTGFKFIVSSNLDSDFDIIQQLSIDLFVFDSYLGDNCYLNKMKLKGKLMLIDDNNDIYDSTIPNIIYNGNIHANALGYAHVENQLRLLGTRYLIMKEEYWESRRDKDIEKDGILITTGGTDEYGIILNILKYIKNINIKTKVILGPGFKPDYIKQIEETASDYTDLIYRPHSLREHIASSEIVITATGSTVYEVLLQGSIPIIFSIADNQNLIYKELSKMGISHIGKCPDINYCILEEKIKTAQENKSILRNRCSGLISGKGARMSAKILLEQLSCKIGGDNGN